EKPTILEFSTQTKRPGLSTYQRTSSTVTSEGLRSLFSRTPARISMILGMSSRESRDPQCEASEGPFEAIGGSHRPQRVRVRFGGSPVSDHWVGGTQMRLPCCQRRAPTMPEKRARGREPLNPSHWRSYFRCLWVLVSSLKDERARMTRVAILSDIHL